MIELHGLGYTHRDLKPETIVLNLDPFEVRITDFTAAYPSSQKTRGLPRGSPGYFPEGAKWNDGSSAWDLYSLGVIVLESDMTKDVIFETTT
jgi:serine/threonine protein kinase